MGSTPPSEDITALLAEIEEGRPDAAERFWQAIYTDLCRTTHPALRRHPGQTLGTTALINEAYLKLPGRV